MYAKLKADIRVGDILEGVVREKLENNGWRCVHIDGKFHYWDFAIERGGITAKIEVKHDVFSDTTGNYCIEKRWLEHTIASILIIGTPREAWMIPVVDVKKLVQGYTPRQTGDSPTNLSYLIPKTVFIPHARRFI